MFAEYWTLKELLIALLFCLLLTIITGYVTIPILKRLKAGQTILSYVKSHDKKNGTPTMGGLFFIIPTAIIFLIFGGGQSQISLVALSVGIAFMIVGFLDDFIKVRYKKNEGLKAYQKIIFQFAVAIIVGVYCYNNGITRFYVPFVNGEINLGIFTIPIVIIILLAITNSVNLTDGLDGLAGQVSCVYLVFLCALIFAQYESLKVLYLGAEEYHNLLLLSTCLIGGVLGFLLFNVSKARVFMGDTGSLSLGGFLGAISIFSLNGFFIPLLGIMFVASSISVIVQVAHYKKTKKRVFLMAPLHHHFQLKGYSETQIGYVYSLITAVCGIIAVLSYL